MSDQIDLAAGGTVTRSWTEKGWRFEFFGRLIASNGVEVEMTHFERCAVICLLGGVPDPELVAVAEARRRGGLE